jgi:exonuclease III
MQQFTEILYLLGMGLGEFKLISLNVRGLSNFKKRKSILTWCRKHKVDIIFQQETHSTIEKEKQWKAEWGGPIELAHAYGSTKCTRCWNIISGWF